MSGLVKPKKYDWKDSNMALFGSDTEKQVKKESAQTEPAWTGAGEEVGVQVWRIVKFKVEHWDKEQYGQFFNGDSYIILNSFKEEDEEEINYDVHFWIGKYSTQDEYATAAYKTVELDTLLDDKPVQHREVQGHESPLFKSYFESTTILKGGADTGFNRVVPEEYPTRLFHVMKDPATKKITCQEVSCKRANISEDDVYILDRGNQLDQINGSNCSHDEKFKAAQEISKIASSRGKAKRDVTEGKDDAIAKFGEYLRDSAKKEKAAKEAWPGNSLYRLCIQSCGNTNFDAVKENDDSICRDDFKSEDVFFFDTEDGLFVWIGGEASVDERRNALSHSHKFLSKSPNPCKAVTVVSEGKESKEFKAFFGGEF